LTKDEALQMCLEYIETDAHERRYVRHAIKAALAQPAQETDWRAAYKEAVRQHSLTLDELREALAQPAACCAECGKKKFDGWALYCVDCIDPPQRPWVGLTDEEIEAAWRAVETSDFYDCVVPLSRAVEAKLRSKNI